MTYDPGADAGTRPPTVAHAASLPVPARAAARRRRGAAIPPAAASPAAVPVPPRRGRSAPIWIDRRARPGADRRSSATSSPRSAPARRSSACFSRWCRSPACSSPFGSSTAGSRSRVGLLVFAVAWGAIAAVGDRARRRSADHDGLRRPTTRPHARRSPPSCRRRSSRSSPRDSASTSSSSARGARSTGRSTAIVYGALDRGGVRLHREHPVLRDQLHRGRRGGCVGDVLRARHPLAVRACDVHERHGLRPRARRATGSERRPGGRTVGARHARGDRAARVLERLCGVPRLLRAVPHAAGAALRRFILGIIALRREEARLTRTRLGDYAAAGWFTAQEVDMLATGSGRRRRSPGRARCEATAPRS